MPSRVQITYESDIAGDDLVVLKCFEDVVKSNVVGLFGYTQYRWFMKRTISSKHFTLLRVSRTDGSEVVLHEDFKVLKCVSEKIQGDTASALEASTQIRQMLLPYSIKLK